MLLLSTETDGSTDHFLNLHSKDGNPANLNPIVSEISLPAFHEDTKLPKFSAYSAVDITLNGYVGRWNYKLSNAFGTSAKQP